MKQERIKWINGLKGIACLAVFLHHFLLDYYPAAYSGLYADSKLPFRIDALLGRTPLGIICNGNFAVCLFVLISSFLFAGKVIKKDLAGERIDLLPACIKRYISLVIPIALIGVFLYGIKMFLYRIGIFLPSFTFSLSFGELLEHIFVYQWIEKDIMIMGALWSMKAILQSSILAMFLALLGSQKRKYMPCFYLLLLVPFGIMDALNLAAIFGVLLADWHYYKRADAFTFLKWTKSIVMNRVLFILLLVSGLLLGGYPSTDENVHGFYTVFRNLFLNIFQDTDCSRIHSLAAALIFAALMMRPAAGLLCSKAANFLGDISLGIYLMHPVVIVFFADLIKPTINRMIIPYNFSMLVLFLLTTLVVILVAILFQRVNKVIVNRVLQLIGNVAGRIE